MSKRLVIQSLLNNNPHLSAAKLRQEIFNKFYRNDFTPEAAAKIIEHLVGRPISSDTLRLRESPGVRGL
ncbi:MAG: hypothetical protein WCF65_06815 [Parachlamydiaceae bacterium]